MKGTEILYNQIGRTLKDGKIQSFVLKDELKDLVNVTFLKFDNWINLVLSEGELEIKLMDNGFERPTDQEDDEFKYPISNLVDSFPEFKMFKGLKLRGFKELVLKKNEELTSGIKLFFDNDAFFIIYDEEKSDLDRNVLVFNRQIPDNSKEK